MRPGPHAFYRTRGKRILDLALAIPIALAVAPVAGVVAAAVLIGLGRPLLFVQTRTGLGGRRFELIKFRTMRRLTDAAGRPMPDEQRLTTLGKVLRRWSLDELPELLNVLRGDMSLVGPRPLLPEYLGRYSSRQARRHEVRPGLTGWAQIHGRNAVGWEQRFELDVWYVDHASAGLDLAILWKTLGLVCSGRGISEAGHATMSPFMGTPTDRDPR